MHTDGYRLQQQPATVAPCHLSKPISLPGKRLHEPGIVCWRQWRTRDIALPCANDPIAVVARLRQLRKYDRLAVTIQAFPQEKAIAFIMIRDAKS